ncbi:Cytosolic Ca2-dependent cysteine protease (calpain), large subunit (EF-Hand protein superfamily) [Ceraceosorus bombacis]|uniref:Cytosolic Ca2-dependent cysteine protease (Calpain), large subunit (EF-Hand protein superfamily) n=1 Tax=Ceraceosorus bombacis TaxID=401625 RepID=A0A0P1BMU1_9BASI|nr:Cytosolic Ca2-dependent cysteine protease (calpain), large subunit (EF-Hand protein superfamily) [Ceraceosorus bombacis]
MSSTWSDQAASYSTAGAKSELSRDYDGAFTNYVRAAEIYMRLARSGESADVRERARNAAGRVMQRAEKVRPLRRDKGLLDPGDTAAQQSRTLSASALIAGLRYEQWDGQGGPSNLKPLPLSPFSPAQQALGVQYRSPNGTIKGKEPLRGEDIRQDVVTDCSVVAALEAAAEHDIVWGTKLASSALFPQDANGRPCKSPAGEHKVRLHLNGTTRCVPINDELPCYADGTPMCARGQQRADEASPSASSFVLWPSLIEKAYLRVMGGYDFRGSNSAADLYALTGWIPEQVGLGSHAGFQREKTWERLSGAWKKGDVIITAGTGAGANAVSSTDANGSLDLLVDSHDYAVLQLGEKDGSRSVLCLNPWSSQRGRDQEGRLHLDSVQSPANPNDALRSEPFWMSWDEVCERFDALYVNWNPSLMKHSVEAHFTLRKQGTAAPDLGESMRQNPQLKLDILKSDGACEGKEVWLHLARHFGPTKENLTGSGDYVALHVFENAGNKRMYRQRVDGKMGTYIDGMHNLVRFRVPASTSGSYTLVVSRHGGADDASFTLRAHGTHEMTLSELPRAHPHEISLPGAWKARSAGGNSTFATFVHNPQFRMIVPSTSSNADILLTLEASKDLPVQALLLWSSGRRVSHCISSDVVASSGDFSYGLAVLQASVQAGSYTLVLQTFEPGQEGSFMLNVQSSIPYLVLEQIPPEGAGMYTRCCRGSWNVSSSPPKFKLEVKQPSSKFVVRLQSREVASSGRPAVQLSIMDAATGRQVETSGPFVDHVCGVLIDDLRLSQGEYFLLPRYHGAGIQTGFFIDVHSDAPIVCTPA